MKLTDTGFRFFLQDTEARVYQDFWIMTDIYFCNSYQSTSGTKMGRIMALYKSAIAQFYAYQFYCGPRTSTMKFIRVLT